MFVWNATHPKPRKTWQRANGCKRGILGQQLVECWLWSMCVALFWCFFCWGMWHCGCPELSLAFLCLLLLWFVLACPCFAFIFPPSATLLCHLQRPLHRFIAGCPSQKGTGVVLRSRCLKLTFKHVLSLVPTCTLPFKSADIVACCLILIEHDRAWSSMTLSLFLRLRRVSMTWKMGALKLGLQLRCLTTSSRRMKARRFQAWHGCDR